MAAHLDTTKQTCNNVVSMDVKLAVLADYASITREGKLNILGIFDSINPQKLPVALPIFYVVVAYTAGPAEYGAEKKTEVVLCDDDGKELFRTAQSIQVPRPTKGHVATANQIGALMMLPFQKAGDYQFSILVNGEEKTTIPLRVNEATQK